MPNVIEITDFAAPELDVYAQLTQLSCAAAWNRKKAFLLPKAPR